MFAIALWDTRTRQLVLARDRTGKKPLYVYEDAEKLVFAPDQSDLLAYPDVNTREWPEAAGQFLSPHGYVPTPHTFYAQIRKVKPSHFEVLDRQTRDAGGAGTGVSRSAANAASRRRTTGARWSTRCVGCSSPP